MNSTQQARNPYLTDYREKRRYVRHGTGRGRKIRRLHTIAAALAAGAVVLAVVCVVNRRPRVDGSVQPAGKVMVAEDFREPVGGDGTTQGINPVIFAEHPDWKEDFLTPNEYSRPGEELPEVTNIFVHYTANRNTSATQNRSYFENLKDTHETSASAHFIIGYDGEIIQCIPLDEIAYAVQTRNYDSISIECCYKSKDGSFTRETYDSLLVLLDWLMEAYDLQPEDILRHYDCGGKKCPIYYTENPDAWEQLKKDLDAL